MITMMIKINTVTKRFVFCTYLSLKTSMNVRRIHVEREVFAPIYPAHIVVRVRLAILEHPLPLMVVPIKMNV